MSVQQQALDMLVRSIDPTSLIREYLCTRKKSVSQAIELLPQEIQLLGFMDKLHAIVHLGDLVVIYAAALLGKYEAAHAAQVLRKFIAMIELLEDRIRYLARICKIENECRILLCYCLAQENQFEEALRLAGDVKINSLTCEFAYFKAYCYFEKRQFKEAAQVIKDYVKNVDESLTSEAPVTADMFDLYANCLSHIGDNSSAQISFSNAISMASDESSQILHSFNKALHDISIGSLQISKRLLEMISRVILALRYIC
jgi:tetratricopeptide (TPR) repeat protein